MRYMHTIIERAVHSQTSVLLLLLAGWTGSFFQTGGWAFTQEDKSTNMTIRSTGGDLNLTMTMAVSSARAFFTRTTATLYACMLSNDALH